MKNVLQTGCLIAGILCLFYFIMILLYVGSTEWFQFVWLLGGVLFLGLWRAFVYQAAHPDSRVSYVTDAVLLLILAGVLVILILGSCVIRGMLSRPQDQLDYVIVLGAQVRGTQPSRALRKRLDLALEYAKENPETVFILSGGQGPDEEISEAQCMFRYMKERGMSAERLILEDRSTSTQENLKFSAAFLDRERDRIGILSNNFHIYRALVLAEKEGYRQICGIPAQSDAWMQPHYVLREIFALAASMLSGMLPFHIL